MLAIRVCSGCRRGRQWEHSPPPRAQRRPESRIARRGTVAQEKKDDRKPIPKVEKKTYEFKDAGKDMEYALFVPSGYDKEKKSPLIIALHGLGGNPQQFMRTRGLTEQAEKRGYIV